MNGLPLFDLASDLERAAAYEELQAALTPDTVVVPPPDARTKLLKPRKPKPTIDQAFRAFHKANPQVYRMLVRYAREAKGRGRTRLGIGVLWERLRWYVGIETYDGTTAYKLNNNHRAAYARLIMAQEPDLADFFETRQLRSK